MVGLIIAIIAWIFGVVLIVIGLDREYKSVMRPWQKLCSHKFDIKDSHKMKSDIKCSICDKKLSELKDESRLK